MDQRGTVRRTICVGSWAVKIARNGTGRRCNSFEADLWARTSARRRAILCPVLARLPFGVAILMPRAEPLSEDEADHLRATREAALAVARRKGIVDGLVACEQTIE
jgi:glutamine amidotransferase PdxT